MDRLVERKVFMSVLASLAGLIPLASGASPATGPAPQTVLWMFPSGSAALTVLIVSLVAASGLALGSLKYKGLTLGIPGVMFTGLIIVRLLGREHLNDAVIAFIRDFGLILFVYAVGVQVGPGFF